MGRFNFIPHSARRSSNGDANFRPSKLIAGAAVVLLGSGALVGWLVALRLNRPHDNDEMSGPVILAMRKLGDLHTASYMMKDVFKQTSEVEPDSVVGAIPGGASLVHWASRNEALVVAEGTVEAGLDLTGVTPRDIERVKLPNGGTTLRVHLPPITVYPANVHIQVEQSNPGPFYRDDNIVPKAETTARRRFTEAALKGDLRAQAQRNAISILAAMQHNLGTNVEFTF